MRASRCSWLVIAWLCLMAVPTHAFDRETAVVLSLSSRLCEASAICAASWGEKPLAMAMA